MWSLLITIAGKHKKHQPQDQETQCVRTTTNNNYTYDNNITNNDYNINNNDGTNSNNNIDDKQEVGHGQFQASNAILEFGVLFGTQKQEQTRGPNFWQENDKEEQLLLLLVFIRWNVGTRR